MCSITRTKVWRTAVPKRGTTEDVPRGMGLLIREGSSDRLLSGMRLTYISIPFIGFTMDVIQVGILIGEVLAPIRVRS